jgi:hypothetical protein
MHQLKAVDINYQFVNAAQDQWFGYKKYYMRDAMQTTQ